MELSLPGKLLDGLPDALIVVDVGGVALFANTAALELFGVSVVGTQVGIPLLDFAVVEIPQKGSLRRVELRIADASEWRQGSKAIIFRDVTEREFNKESLLEKVQELSGLGELLEVIPAPVARVDDQGRIIWTNESFKSTFGAPTNLHDIPLLMLEPTKVAELIAVDEMSPLEFGKIRSHVFQSTIDGTLPITAQSVQLAASTSELSTRVEFAILISSNPESNDLLHSYMNLLFFDIGLGLPNLRGLVIQSEEDFANSDLEQACMSIMVHGLDAQDQEIMSVRLVDQIKSATSEILKSNDGNVDTANLNSIRLGRISDDTLCLIIGSSRNGGIGADSMLTALSTKLMAEIRQNVTFGLLVDTRSAASLSLAIEHSMIAAQLAAENAEMVHSFTDDYGQVIQQRKFLSEALREAIAQKAFTIVYQPRIDVKTQKIVSAEVLARWSHETLGQISPEEFVPILRRLNLLSDLTQIVALQAITQVKDWKARGYDPLTLSINIMPGDLTSAKTLSVLRSLAHEYTGKDRLELEMSEMNPFESETHAGLRALLENLGIELSIDDFGKGYSSFAYLLSLPISCIKVDKAYSDNLLVPQRKASAIALFRSIVALARELKIAVCAEGIETQAQFDDVAILGIDQIQGYFFSKPIEAKALEEKYLVKSTGADSVS